LDIKEHKKILLTYLGVAIVSIVVDRIYSIFGHGVYSAAMSLMFLYPLLAGVIYFILFVLLLKKAHLSFGFRLFKNLYASMVTLLTVRSFLQGIFEIAGTNSPYLVYFYYVSALMAGSCFMLVLWFTKQSFMKKIK
jgi:F0F1-type ATP synthase membrane subunit a